MNPTQPQKYTIEQFGAKIKEKYPQYSKYSDKEIGEQTLINHPEYKDRILSPIVARENARKQVRENDLGGKIRKGATDYFGRVAEDVTGDVDKRVGRVEAIQNRERGSVDAFSGAIQKGVQTFGQGAGMVANAIEKTVTEIPGVDKVLAEANKGIDWLATSHLSPFKHLGDVIGSTKVVQKLVDKYDTDPDFKDSIDAIANTIRLGGDVEAIVQSANFAKNVVDKVLKGKPIVPKIGSFEQISEEGGGWKPGMEKHFDEALRSGDKKTVLKMLPDVPEQYKITFANKIKGVVGDKALSPPSISAEAGLNIAPKVTRGVAENIVKDVVPTTERLVNTEVTKALDLTQGDVKNIHLSTGNEVGEFIADRNLIGVNQADTLKKIKDYYKENYNTVRDEINKIKTTYDQTEVPRYKEALMAIKKEVTGTAGLQGANYEIDQLLKKPRVSVADVQRVKELMDDHFSLYKATGDVKEGVAKQGLTEIRKDIKEWIENEVKDKSGVDIRELNKNVQTARSIADAVEERTTRGVTRATISAGDIVTFLSGSAFGSPITGVLAVIGKKIYQSPSFKLRFSKWLDEFSDAKKSKMLQELKGGTVPNEIKEIQSSIESTQSNT